MGIHWMNKRMNRRIWKSLRRKSAGEACMPWPVYGMERCWGWEDSKMACLFTTENALDCQDMSWEKNFSGRDHLCRITECSFMNDMCPLHAVHNTAASSLGWAFLHLVDEEVFSRMFFTGHAIASVFFFFLPCPVSIPGWLVPLSLMELPVWQPTDSSLAFCQMLALMLWQLDHKSFTGNIPDSYKNTFTKENAGNWNIFEIITAGPGFIVGLWYSLPQRNTSDTDGFKIV